jgi:hypothetical protein
MSGKLKFASSFKNYFRLGEKKLSLKKYYQRFGEKWYKDPKFRFKCILGFFGICKKNFPKYLKMINDKLKFHLFILQ